VSFEAESLAVPRRVELVDDGGDVVATATVPTGRRERVSFSVEFSHRERFTVRTTPGPESAPELTGGDTRTLSVSFTDPRLTIR
jgi:hypothetical protein